MTDATNEGKIPLAETVLRRSLACHRCGYDLRGLPVTGQCPECGEDVWETLQVTVDPAARRLPQIRQPRAVGNALVGLVGCLLAAAVLVVLRPAAIALDAVLPVGNVGASIPVGLVVWAGAFALAGLVPVFMLFPPRGEERGGAVRRDLWRLVFGLQALGIIIILAAVLLPMPGQPAAELMLHLAGLGAAVVVLVALRRVLRVIGERSREFRTASGGRQRVRDLIAGVIGIALGDTLRIVGEATSGDGLRIAGTVVAWSSMFMLLLGLGYLLVNAWWIRRALCRPPPTVGELLEPPVSADEEADGSSE